MRLAPTRTSGCRSRHAREARAPILLGEIGAEHPEFGELGDEFIREAPLHIAVADDGQNARIDEATNGVANGALLFSERGIDVEQVARVGGELYGRERGDRARHQGIECHCDGGERVRTDVFAECSGRQRRQQHHHRVNGGLTRECPARDYPQGFHHETYRMVQTGCSWRQAHNDWGGHRSLPFSVTRHA